VWAVRRVFQRISLSFPLEHSKLVHIHGFGGEMKYFTNKHFQAGRHPVFQNGEWHCQNCNRLLGGTGEICGVCAKLKCENCDVELGWHGIMCANQATPATGL
jgi:hypothetical protein